MIRLGSSEEEHKRAWFAGEMFYFRIWSSDINKMFKRQKKFNFEKVLIICKFTQRSWLGERFVTWAAKSLAAKRLSLPNLIRISFQNPRWQRASSASTEVFSNDSLCFRLGGRCPNCPCFAHHVVELLISQRISQLRSQAREVQKIKAKKWSIYNWRNDHLSASFQTADSTRPPSSD